MNETERILRKTAANHHYNVDLNSSLNKMVDDNQITKALKIVNPVLDDLIGKTLTLGGIYGYKLQKVDGVSDKYNDKIEMTFFKNNDLEFIVRPTKKCWVIIRLCEMNEEEELEHDMLKECNLI